MEENYSKVKQINENPVLNFNQDTIIRNNPDLIIENYDKEGVGNHHVGNFIEALQQLDYDFDVVRITDDLYGYNGIIIQTDDIEKLKEFDAKSNKNAIEHDKYLGDGKYWNTNN